MKRRTIQSDPFSADERGREAVIYIGSRAVESELPQQPARDGKRP